MASTFGWSKRLSELPRRSATWRTESAGPTTFTLSPICRRRWLAPKSSMPERVMRVTLTL